MIISLTGRAETDGSRRARVSARDGPGPYWIGPISKARLAETQLRHDSNARVPQSTARRRWPPVPPSVLTRTGAGRPAASESGPIDAGGRRPPRQAGRAGGHGLPGQYWPAPRRVGAGGGGGDRGPMPTGRTLRDPPLTSYP